MSKNVSSIDLAAPAVENTASETHESKVSDDATNSCESSIVSNHSESGSVEMAPPTRRTFRFHVLGIAHLPAAAKYVSCAFTQKIHKLCGMLVAKGHHVILYAAEGSDAPCSELVQTHSLAQIREQFGDKNYDGDEEIGYDWQSQQFRHDFGTDMMLRKYVRHRQIAEIEMRKKPDDFLVISMGSYHKEVSQAVGLYLECESGIGYFGYFARFRAYESDFIRYFSRGEEGKSDHTDGRHYYRVIPNYYRMQDFPYVAEPAGDENGEPYVVYLGRIIQRKGLETVVEATRHANVRCIIAGQGGRYNETTHTLTVDRQVFQLTAKQSFYGFADVEARKTLLGNAIAVITPTYYMEPFCGVSAEAQLCGTPAITTSFGAFSDNVEHGRTGFLCCTTNDFALACGAAHKLDRAYIRKRAKARWSCEAVNEQYEKWWQDLYDVYESTLPKEQQPRTADGKPRALGFSKVRSEREEIEAGTREDFFAPRVPYDQMPL